MPPLTQILREFFPTVYERYGPLNARQYNYRAEAIGIMRKTKSTWNTGNTVLVALRDDGILPWDAVTDSVRTWGPWPANGSENPEDHLHSVIGSFLKSWKYLHLPRWHRQSTVPILVTEKHGLIPFFERHTNEFETTVYAIRGQAGKSHLRKYFVPFVRDIIHEHGQEVALFYLGDHDDEGYQIQETLKETLAKFDIPLVPKRLALTPELVASQGIRLDPLNLKSTIAGKYVEGKAELEALDPDILTQIIREAIEPLVDQETLRVRDEALERIRSLVRSAISDLTDNWPSELKEDS